METLTLAKVSRRNRPRSLAPVKVSGLGISPKRATVHGGGGRAPAAVAGPAAETPAPEPLADAKAAAPANPDPKEPGLGSPEKGKAEDLAGATGGRENPPAVGDIVWAKTKTYSWWPAQVFDPSRAPEHVRNARRKKHCALAAYFADDGSCTWCDPSQVKPFTEDFRQMASQCSNRSFVDAVADAIDMIGRSLEAELACCCLPAEARAGIETIGAAGRAGELSITNYAPGEFLERLRDVARDTSAADLLDATMLWSWVSALGKLCLSSGSFVYHQRLRTEDLVDEIVLDAPTAETIASTSASEILSQLLCTALNPLHLKWNRSAKTVRGFFHIYRSSVYSSISDGDSYKKHLRICSCTDGNMADRHEDGRSQGKRRRKGGANEGTPSDLGKVSTDHSEQGKAGPMKKMRKDGATKETPSGSVHDATDRSEQGKPGPERKMMMDAASIDASVDLNLQIANGSEEGETLNRKRKGKDGANCVLVDCFEEGGLGSKKKSKGGSISETLVNVGCEITNGKEAVKSSQREGKKDATICGDPAALLLTFAKGVSPPSLNDLISTFSEHGDLIEVETLSSNEFGCARVLFATSTDAEKAFNSWDKIGAFGPPVLSYHLCN